MIFDILDLIFPSLQDLFPDSQRLHAHCVYTVHIFSHKLVFNQTAKKQAVCKVYNLCRSDWRSLALTGLIKHDSGAAWIISNPNPLRCRFWWILQMNLKWLILVQLLYVFKFEKQMQNPCNTQWEMHTCDQTWEGLVSIKDTTVNHLLYKQSNMVKCTLLMQNPPLGSDQRRCRALHPNQVSSEVGACTNSWCSDCVESRQLPSLIMYLCSVRYTTCY